MKIASPSSVRGFTLVELMVVIVIIGILASLVMLNIDGVDQRKAMQARELLILDLKKINRESSDQSRIFALKTQPESDVASFRYFIEEYHPINQGQKSNSASRLQGKTSLERWTAFEEFEAREYDAGISFRVQVQDHQFENAKNTDLIGANAPQLIWFGNGEAKPVNIQMYLGPTPVGEMIQVDYLGKVSEAS